MNRIRKLASLLSLLRSSPLEFRDRLAMLLAVRIEARRRRRPNRGPDDSGAALARLDEVWGRRVSAFLKEAELARFSDEMRRRTRDLAEDAVLATAHNADFALARFCYAACRALEPEVVVETGVAYGVTSAFVLEALRANGRGTLHSVDLPPLGAGAGRLVGAAIPDELRSRWRLHRGMSGRLLPALVKSLGSVDIFMHDSLHTYRNMKQELDAVTPRLARPSLVIADDVDGNAAFDRWSDEVDPAFRGVLREEGKAVLFGVALLL
jgi:predicted O-methyltransferase YrrM